MREKLAGFLYLLGCSVGLGSVLVIVALWGAIEFGIRSWPAEEAQGIARTVCSRMAGCVSAAGVLDRGLAGPFPGVRVTLIFKKNSMPSPDERDEARKALAALLPGPILRWLLLVSVEAQPEGGARGKR